MSLLRSEHAHVRPADAPDPNTEVTVHVHGPQSDILNDPTSVGRMVLPSLSATGMVAPFWDTAFNLDDRMGDVYQGNMLFYNPAVWTQNIWPNANTQANVPQGVQTTALRAHFNTILAALQDHLAGAP